MQRASASLIRDHSLVLSTRSTKDVKPSLLQIQQQQTRSTAANASPKKTKAATEENADKSPRKQIKPAAASSPKSLRSKVSKHSDSKMNSSSLHSSSSRPINFSAKKLSSNHSNGSQRLLMRDKLKKHSKNSSYLCPGVTSPIIPNAQKNKNPQVNKEQTPDTRYIDLSQYS